MILFTEIYYRICLVVYHSRICLEHCSLYGQTAQAFAYSVLKMLWCFEGKLAILESAYQKPKDDDVQVSLLCLKQQLMNDFIEFEIVHEIIVSSHLSGK